jgi:hypothetical protein
VDLCLKALSVDGFETGIVDLFDYTIEPCSHCSYECLGEHITGTAAECPKQDDLPGIYSRFEEADIVVMGIPTYCGQPPSLFRIFQERSLGIYRLWKHVDILRNKVFGFIVLKDHFTIEAATRLYSNSAGTHWVYLSPVDYGVTSVSDDLTTRLVEIPDVRSRLRAMAGRLAASVPAADAP